MIAFWGDKQEPLNVAQNWKNLFFLKAVYSLSIFKDEFFSILITTFILTQKTG